jgi:hypothetical protein
MSVTRPDEAFGTEMAVLEPEMVEITLLLPRQQAEALQIVAKQRGMSAGQLLRRMITAAVGSQMAVPAESR